MNKLEILLSEQPDRKRYVELTEGGPLLFQSNLEAAGINTITTYEVDEPTWNKLMELLQTGQLDNAKVKAIIKAQQ
jgi:hypothetical protein